MQLSNQLSSIFSPVADTALGTERHSRGTHFLRILKIGYARFDLLCLEFQSNITLCSDLPCDKRLRTHPTMNTGVASEESQSSKDDSSHPCTYHLSP